MDNPLRSETLYQREKDSRTPFQKDYDRILYSSAFNRLAGVTQVVNPSEGLIFHNRLTHSSKVAQVGSRLAEYIIDWYIKDDSREEELITWAV